jgi:predicted type IV restriction endonuclease
MTGALMRDAILDIRQALAANRFPNEAAVSLGVVLRILNALSWPTFNTGVVAPEYALEGRRVDFALCYPPGVPRAFIEVKQVGQSSGADRQLFEYAFHRGVPLAILTDGREWHFYLPGEQGIYDERRVYKLDLLEREPEESVDRLRRYLEYDAVCSGKAIEAAREDYRNAAKERQIRATLPDAWTKLVEDRDELLLDLLADKVESLCGYKPDPDTVISFLRSHISLRNSSGEPVNREKPPSSSRQIGNGPPTTGFTFGGHVYPARNARDVLVQVMELLADRDPTFLERFASRVHGSKRHYLARSKYDLYPGRRDLAENQSRELRSGWWLGVHLSRQGIEKIIEQACSEAGIRFGSDLRINLGG